MPPPRFCIVSILGGVLQRCHGNTCLVRNVRRLVLVCNFCLFTGNLRNCRLFNKSAARNFSCRAAPGCLNARRGAFQFLLESHLLGISWLAICCRLLPADDEFEHVVVSILSTTLGPGVSTTAIPWLCNFLSNLMRGNFTFSLPGELWH